MQQSQGFVFYPVCIMQFLSYLSLSYVQILYFVCYITSFFCNMRLFMYNRVKYLPINLKHSSVACFLNQMEVIFAFPVEVKLHNICKGEGYKCIFFLKKLVNLLTKLNVLFKIHLVVALRGSGYKHKAFAIMCQI